MVPLRNSKTYIINIIDWFYKPFQKFIPVETFRYAVCGGSNTVLDITLFFITYNYILQKKIVHFKFISVSPYIGAFIMVFPITFATGFLMSKYITFPESELRGRIQLIRYILTVFVCIILNYIFLKFFVEVCGLYPTFAKIVTTGVVVIYSYFSQKYFTFKTQNKLQITL